MTVGGDFGRWRGPVGKQAGAQWQPHGTNTNTGTHAQGLDTGHNHQGPQCTRPTRCHTHPTTHRHGRQGNGGRSGGIQTESATCHLLPLPFLLSLPWWAPCCACMPAWSPFFLVAIVGEPCHSAAPPPPARSCCRLVTSGSVAASRWCPHPITSPPPPTPPPPPTGLRF